MPDPSSVDFLPTIWEPWMGEDTRVVLDFPLSSPKDNQDPEVLASSTRNSCGSSLPAGFQASAARGVPRAACRAGRSATNPWASW